MLRPGLRSSDDGLAVGFRWRYRASQDVGVSIIPKSGLEKSPEIRAVVAGLQKSEEVVGGILKHERAIRTLIDLLWWADVDSDVAPADVGMPPAGDAGWVLVLGTVNSQSS